MDKQNQNTYDFDCVATGIFRTTISVQAESLKEAKEQMQEQQDNCYELYYDIVKMENLTGDMDEAPDWEHIGTTLAKETTKQVLPNGVTTYIEEETVG